MVFLCAYNWWRSIPLHLLLRNRVGERTETNIELLDILLRNRCNAFYIQGRLRDCPATSGMTGTSRGCGIYVRNSFFNHSCKPNVNYWVVENSLKVECTAGEDVAAGDELCISYIDTQQDLASRRAKLQESYPLIAKLVSIRYTINWSPKIFVWVWLPTLPRGGKTTTVS